MEIGPTRRHRTGSRSATSPIAVEFHGFLQNISDSIPNTKEPIPSAVIHLLCNDLRRIRQLLIDNPSRGQARDAFRHVGGFVSVIDILRAFEGYYDSIKLSRDERTDFFELVRADLDVLSEALNDHAGNRRFFAKRVEGGGWKALEQALAKSGVAESDMEGHEQLFGQLFAFALAEEEFSTTFRGTGKDVKRRSQPRESGLDAKEEKVDEESADNATAIDLAVLTKRLQSRFGGNEVLRNPEMFPIIVHFWKALSTNETKTGQTLSIAVLVVLQIIMNTSIRNATSIHGTQAITLLLPLLFKSENKGVTEDPPTQSILRELVTSLIPYGINRLDDACLLFKLASTSDPAAEFLLKGLQASSPSFIQFDHSLHGHSSVELKTMGRSFPPSSNSTGYTLTCWFRVDAFDPEVHTTIFGCYDQSQTSFLLAYLDRDTGHFILQTSVKNSRPSVRFKSTIFEAGVWYHVAVVHKKPRATTFGNSSKACLFVDGNFVEQTKCQYPALSASTSSDSFTSLTTTSPTKPPKIEAFLGTPATLALRLGRNVVRLKWSLSAFHLFGDALSDDLIAVHYRLGLRYTGNFQDLLGSFQTYRDSAELNRQNELLHPGAEDKSEIASACRQKASNLMSESRVIISFTPSAVLDNEDRNHVNESRLIKSLSKDAARDMRNKTRAGGNPIILNAAVPSINDALTQLHGAGTLVGDPVVMVPQAIDDAFWRIAGSAAIGLKLVELARTKEAVLRAMQIFFQSLEGNWRNSEAVEKDGYQVLAGLLREKLGFSSIFSESQTSRKHAGPVELNEREELALESLRMILRFVGYEEANPSESLLINPLAYRVLLVDFDTWRKTPIATQKLYYSQFMHFAASNRNHLFNSRRLVRMRIVKRLLDALKGENFSADVFPDFLEAFAALLRCNVSRDNLRSIALFVTYALQDNRALPYKALLAHTPRLSQTPKNGIDSALPALRSGGLLSASTPKSASPNKPSTGICGGNELSRHEVGVQILNMFTDLLCDPTSTEPMKKFAKTVANKWLMFLLDETDPRIVFLSTKILIHMLLDHGPAYVKRFSEVHGGFTVLRHRLKSWWNMPAIWTLLFSLMFGVNPNTINFEEDFNHFALANIFSRKSVNVVYPETFSVLTGMLEFGLRAIVQDGYSAAAEAADGKEATSNNGNGTSKPTSMGRDRSMSLSTDQDARAGNKTPVQRIANDAEVLNTVIRFLADLHLKWATFRDFAVTSNYVQELLFVLYPIIVTSDSVSAETELNSRGSALTFEGQDVVIRPHVSSENMRPPIVRTATIEPPPSPSMPRAAPFRRSSSFILITSEKGERGPSPARFSAIMSPNSTTAPVALRVGNSIVEGLLEVIITVFLDQILHRKDFTGFGLFLKVPPGFQEHQAYFESFVLQHAMNALGNSLRLNPKPLTDPRTLTNVTRYVSHMAEAVFEGWFLNGADALLDFLGSQLDYLMRPEIAQQKNVQICFSAITTMRRQFIQLSLLRLSELDDSLDTGAVTSFINQKMTHSQPIILNWPKQLQRDDSGPAEAFNLRLMFYLLYIKFVSNSPDVAAAVLNFWRMVLMQKSEISSFVLAQAAPSDMKHLPNAFMRLRELDNEAFLDWTGRHREDLDSMFFGIMKRSWDEFVANENSKTEESSRNRIEKRRTRLRQWQEEERHTEDIWRRHEVAGPHWRNNIFSSERLRHQRTLQDQAENLNFTASTLARFDRILKGPCSLFEKDPEPKWRLDETEGPHRMRMRIVPEGQSRTEEYQPKRKTSDMVKRSSLNTPKAPLKLDTNVKIMSDGELVGVTPAVASILEAGRQRAASAASQTSNGTQNEEESFEIIADPREDEDGFEDKNRKVMRALERGDVIQHVCNVSRIVGLEGCEGLFILGKDNLYLMDNYFQRADGEVVGVWQAPLEERDQYLQAIPGQDLKARKPRPSVTEQTTRHWRWLDVMVISKRSFLSRDVALEIFFADGRSYLLTTKEPGLRDDLHARLLARSTYLQNPSSMAHSEDAWRLESWRNPDEAPQSIGSKFVNAFTSLSTTPATRRWMRGELSNFHYLMLINTQAGRTFNDLTQYPVFPWVLADYTSDELDLTDPKTFRDLSKPMGCQTLGREKDFRKRYIDLEGLDGEDGVFHYGTHYSSSMVVASYLIRLQPFVQSYLSLQGGSFDHAERLFNSIEKAWHSSSRDNNTDVRELTPEFFYLPEFLVNKNKYNFGATQSSGEQVNDVHLPPWAKGDPKIFIAKHREALECPYVAMQLHKWIDLIFGYKARGEAAVEAVNVFHPITYHRGRDLEGIEDPHERNRHISQIHNFGQTPGQVFAKPHPARESVVHQFKGLDNAAESLQPPTSPLMSLGGKVSSLSWSKKQERLICSGPFRIHVPPTFDKYLEFGFVDGSIRFFSTDGRKQLAMFEHLHIGPPSTAVFLDNRTLVTAGSDSVVSIWNVDAANSKAVNIVLRTGLFGHRFPVTTLAASKHFMSLLSADTSGRVLMWDLNSGEFVRELEHSGPEVKTAKISNATGEVVLAKGWTVKVFTLNGDLLCEKDVCGEDHDGDEVTSVAWYENLKQEWMDRILLVTGSSYGVVKIWHKYITPTGWWDLKLIKQLNPIDNISHISPGPPGSTTSKTATWISNMSSPIGTTSATAINRNGRSVSGASEVSLGGRSERSVSGASVMSIGSKSERSVSSTRYGATENGLARSGNGVPVTALLCVGSALFVGDGVGRVFEWNCGKD